MVVLGELLVLAGGVVHEPRVLGSGIALPPIELEFSNTFFGWLTVVPRVLLNRCTFIHLFSSSF